MTSKDHEHARYEHKIVFWDIPSGTSNEKDNDLLQVELNKYTDWQLVGILRHGQDFCQIVLTRPVLE